MLGNLKDKFENQNFEKIKKNEFDELEQYILNRRYKISISVEEN